MFIKITDIVPSPYQKRTEFKNIESLAIDIQSHGLLQPIIVRPKSVPQSSLNKFELIAGERRLRAYKILAEKFSEFEEIEAKVKEKCDDSAAQAMHLSENLQREDITPLEEAAELSELLEHCTLKQAAEYLGRSAGWIARRANLAKLCPKFMNAYAKNDKIKLWPIEALELVARMPEKVQEDILDRNRERAPTVKELAKEISGRIMKLSAATWSMEDCTGCQKRTAAAPDLFAEINVKKDDRCLDVKCWGKHTEAALSVRVAELKEGGEKFFTVVSGYNEFDPIPNDSDLKQGALREWQINKVKAGSKGAIPALIVGGVGVGETIYIKPNEDNTGRSAAPKGPKTMKEKRAGLEKRRVIRYLEKIIVVVEEMVKKRHEFPYAATVPLVSIFGAERLSSDKQTTWKSPLDCKFNDDHGQAELFACIAPKIIKELHQEALGAFPEKKRGDVFREWLGIQTEKLYADAVAEFPEPKSWAKEEHEKKPAKANKVRSCRVCGCTETTPCIDKESGDSCAWIETDLCSACVGKTEKSKNKKEKPVTVCKLCKSAHPSCKKCCAKCKEKCNSEQSCAKKAE